MTLLDDSRPPANQPAGSGRSWLVPALVAALAVSLVAVVLLWRAWDQAGERSDDVGHAIDVLADPTEEAEAAARDAAVRMTTYDWRSLKKDFSWIDQIGTDRFEEDFTLSSKPVKRAIRLTRTTAQGEVMESAVKLLDEDHAVAVLFVDQLLVDRTSDEPKLDTIRLRIELVERDGRWLVDRIESFEPSGA